jgi:signal transduction histidine kinase/CheY-like chemotaxis protein
MRQRQLAEEYLNEILAKKIELLAERQLSLIVANIFAAGLFIYISWDYFERSQLLMFGLLVLAIPGLARYIFCYVYYRRRPSVFEAQNWAPRFAFVSLISGLVWGASSFWFVTPDHALYLIYVMIIYIGLSASSLGALSAYFPAFAYFTVPFLGLIIIKLIFYSADHLFFMGLMMVLFLAILLIYGLHLNRTNQKIFELGYENLELIDTLKLERDKADQANSAKSRFLAAASHDLRQPLHAMGLYLDIMSGTKDVEMGKMVQRVTQSMKSLEDLLNALLDISKLEAGIVDVHKRPVALNEIFQRMGDAFRIEAKQKDLSLRIHPTTITVFSDPVLIERILRNLITNAIRNTSYGGILLGARKHRDEVLIQVWDTGSGIPVREKEKIFEEFYQIDSKERDRTKGLGLGLAIVNRMTRLLDHRIDVQSKPDKGSVFTVYLPVSHEEVRPERSESQLTSRYKTLFPSKERVLVIDDERDIREATQELLERWGAEVVSVENEFQALDYCMQSEDQIALILSDYRLKDGVKGINVVASLCQELGYEPSTIIITGDTSADVLQEVRSTGYQLLHKPLNPAQLRMAINRLLK